jgi:hypothetical protein
MAASLRRPWDLGNLVFVTRPPEVLRRRRYNCDLNSPPARPMIFSRVERPSQALIVISFDRCLSSSKMRECAMAKE